jgi:predicted dinucleotide-binding enzyme
VGQVIGARLAELGHEVTIGTRDPDATLASAEPGRYGDPPFAVWRDEHPDIALGRFAEAAASGELVVNATNGAASIDALRAAGE